MKCRSSGGWSINGSGERRGNKEWVSWSLVGCCRLEDGHRSSLRLLDPLLICLGRGFTLDSFEKPDKNLCKPAFKSKSLLPPPLSSEDKMLAENIPVPSSPVPIATIDLVQSQSGVGSPATARKTIAVPAKKTKHQEEQEDVSRPAWVLSGAPWVTIAFTIFQIREKINMAKGGGSPPEDQPLQVKEMTRSTQLACRVFTQMSCWNRWK